LASRFPESRALLCGVTAALLHEVQSSPPPDRRSDLRREAARAVPWTILSYGANKAITVLTTIVLARILTPRDFGLVTIAALVVGVISLFSHALGNVIVLEHDWDRPALATALGVMLAASAAATALGVLSAPVVARAFDIPGATSVVAVSAAALSYSGLAGFYEALLRRELRTRALFLCQLFQSLLYAAISISLAGAGAGVWSLVVGGLASSAAFAVAVSAAAPWWLWPRWHARTALRFWNTAKGFLLQSSLWFVSANADYAAVGRYVGAGGLGAYTMSYRLVEIPNLAIADSVAQVSFPSFARMRRGGQDVRPPYLRVLALVALVACPLAVILSATADPFVAAVLGPRWDSAVDPLMVLGIAGAILPLSATGGWLLNSVGEQMASARISAATLALFLGPLIWAAAASGIVAVAAVMLARAVATYALVLVATRRRTGVGIAEHLGVLRAVFPACALAWVASYLLAVLFADTPAAVALAASAVCGFGVYVLIVRILDGGLLTTARSQLALAVSRGEAAPLPASPPTQESSHL
jgi:O-antigen/teichoic acid export membrane protein